MKNNVGDGFLYPVVHHAARRGPSRGVWPSSGSRADETVDEQRLERRAATRELKARGIRYVLVGLDDIGSEDFQQRAPFWGIKFLGEAGNERLYYIE